MSQISPPVRILLIGAVVFLAAWFTLLRPKPETIAPSTTTPTATATATTGLGKAVESARSAGGATPATTATGAAKATATTSAPETKPAAAAIPAAALAKLPSGVARALQARKVLVLGVLADTAKPWRPLSDDDRYVRNALKTVNRYHGDVVVKPVPAAQLSVYSAIVGKLSVTQTPSIVVVDRALKGTVLTGYVDRVAINQAIVDARRASVDPYIADPYLRKVNALCSNYVAATNRLSLPTISGPKARKAAQARRKAVIRGYVRGAGRLSAPAEWRGLRGRLVSQLERDLALSTGHDTTSRAAVTTERSFEQAGVTACAWRNSR